MWNIKCGSYGGCFEIAQQNMVMLTGIMFNDFPKNESIDLLTVIKVNGYQLSKHF